MDSSSQEGDFFASSPPAEHGNVSAQESPDKADRLFIGSDDDEEEGTLDSIIPSRKRKLSDQDKSLHSAEQQPQGPLPSAAGPSNSSTPEPAPEPQWSRRYIGHFCIAGWSLSKGKGYAEQGAKVSIVRQKPKQQTVATKPKQPPKKQTKLSFGNAATPAKASSNSAKPKHVEDYVVRFSNMRGFEVGRLPTEVAIWVSKLMDLGVTEFEGYVVDCPTVLSVGCDILLDIKAYLRSEAFPSARDVRHSRNLVNEPAKNFFEETAETSSERDLRQRKSALTKLFKACDLRPIQSSDVLQQHSEEGNFGSSSMLEHYGGVEALRRSQSPPAVTNGKMAAKTTVLDGDEEQQMDVNDGTEIEEGQLAQVYSKAQKHDAELPEVEPPVTFALSLRPYQKQALGWMQNMEKPAYMRQGKEGQRQDASLHPLWQEYVFPLEDENLGSGGDRVYNKEAQNSFYFNPYIGEMSLEFQPASQGTRGGILADEMGLGKTIMIASLIHANRPSEESREKETSPTQEEQNRAAQAEKKGPRQTSLASAFARDQQAKRMPSAARVTLVVAPMSLVGQWRAELDKASKPGTLSVMLHYGEGKGELTDRLEGGSVDVVITSYGTLVSEYKRFLDAGGATGASATKVSRVAPLYAVDWLRVILDEAHNVRNRTTRNARACHELISRRRWCLTGSPIVNRLTDLYSLLNFLRVEPWGDFAFFNSFIGKPFANKNPKALEIVQIILESILLRREKSFKDKDGRPIVSLPSKSVQMKHLDFTDLERRIYDLCFDRAWIQYQRLRDAGTVNKNLSMIFSVLMKLRQAVCHPLLVLQALQTSHAKAREQGSSEGELDEAAENEVKELVARFQAGQAEEVSEDAQADELMSTIHPDVAEVAQGEEECPICHDPKVEAARLPCRHTACRPCIIEDLQRCENQGTDSVCAVCHQGPFSLEEVEDVAVDQASAQTPQGTTTAPSGTAAKDFSLRKFRSRDFRSSTKLDALIADLAALRREDADFKGVIFSQFTSFLDLVEVILKRHDHPFVRLDGTTSQKDRESVLKTFSSAQGHMLILVSLRAGGVGLNLVAANHCWLLDCWWAEAIENQAVDRVHRIGQVKDVVVHRYLIKDSIEDRILQIQRRKTALVNQALAGSSSDQTNESETVENLRILFGDR